MRENLLGDTLLSTFLSLYYYSKNTFDIKFLTETQELFIEETQKISVENTVLKDSNFLENDGREMAIQCWKFHILANVHFLNCPILTTSVFLF